MFYLSLKILFQKWLFQKWLDMTTTFEVKTIFEIIISKVVFISKVVVTMLPKFSYTLIDETVNSEVLTQYITP